MGLRVPRVAVLLPLLLIPSAPLRAADQPVTGKKLVLKRTDARETLVLVLNDPLVPVPAVGGADDPASSAGLTLTLFGGSPGATAMLSAPPGMGNPGWSATDGVRTRYVYRNRNAPGGASPIAKISLRQGKGLKIVARATGLQLTGPQGSVGVRITTGSTQTCALFAGPGIRTDEAGRFFARDAAKPALAECSDDGLSGLDCTASVECNGLCSAGAECGGDYFVGGCVCVSPSQPCGDTAPVCNGECPAGEECASIGGVPSPSCGCLPVGSTGCGTVYPTCGDGDCPAGTACFVDTFTCCGGVTISGCACLTGPPPPPCGGTCPPGWQCVAIPGQPEFCLPPFCEGGAGAPACDGSCTLAGTTCQAVGGICLCMPLCDGGDPFPTCNGTCSQPGMSCQAAATDDCLCLP